MKRKDRHKAAIKRGLAINIERKLIDQFETGRKGDRRTDRRKIQLIDTLKKLLQ